MENRFLCFFFVVQKEIDIRLDLSPDTYIVSN